MRERMDTFAEPTGTRTQLSRDDGGDSGAEHEKQDVTGDQETSRARWAGRTVLRLRWKSSRAKSPGRRLGMNRMVN